MNNEKQEEKKVTKQSKGTEKKNHIVNQQL